MLNRSLPSSLTPLQDAKEKKICCGSLGNLDLELLKTHCLQAPFGDLETMETKVDPNVRVALELPDDRF
jgi:hypothetical protein